MYIKTTNTPKPVKTTLVGQVVEKDAEDSVLRLRQNEVAVQHSLFKVQIDNHLAANLDVAVAGDLVTLTLYNLQKEILGEPKTFEVNGKMGDLIEVYLDSHGQKLVFNFSKGATLECPLTDLYSLVNSKLTMSDSTETVYGVDAEGNQVNIRVTSDVEPDVVVNRDSKGFLNVPAIPENDEHAVSKFYVDEHDKILNTTKLDKVDTPETLYGVNLNGEQENFKFSETVTSNVIVKRTSGGHLLVPEEPVELDHATSKDYVDTELTKYVALETEQTITGIKHFNIGETELENLGLYEDNTVLEKSTIFEGETTFKNTTLGDFKIVDTTDSKHLIPKSYVDAKTANQVTTNTEQTITAVKHFNAGNTENSNLSITKTNTEFNKEAVFNSNVTFNEETVFKDDVNAEGQLVTAQVFVAADSDS